LSTQVRSAREFADDVHRLVAEFETSSARSLEEYLRALWHSISKRDQANPSYGLFASLLRDGFTLEPASFDDSWLAVTQPPANPWFARKDLSRFGISAPSGGPASVPSATSDWDCLLGTLRFQIGDLRRMGKGKEREKWRYLGSRSPTGNTWYNWDPFLYLDQGASGFLYHLESGHLVGSNNEVCNWAALAFFLEMGRLWE